MFATFVLSITAAMVVFIVAALGRDEVLEVRLHLGDARAVLCHQELEERGGALWQRVDLLRTLPLIRTPPICARRRAAEESDDTILVTSHPSGFGDNRQR